MHSRKQLHYALCFAVFLWPLATSAVPTIHAQSVNDFTHYVNLNTILLTSMTEQECHSLRYTYCIKTGFRYVYATQDAGTETMWVTGTYQFHPTISAGATADPGILERLPARYDLTNRRPSIALFAKMDVNEHIYTKLAFAYSNAGPRIPKDELSRYRNEVSTTLSTTLFSAEVAYAQPTPIGLFQPYTGLHYLLSQQRDAHPLTDIRNEYHATTWRLGMRTVFVLHSRLHLAINWQVENDLINNMYLRQPLQDPAQSGSEQFHTGLSKTMLDNANNIRFAATAGTRFIIKEDVELTFLITRFTQPFGHKLGTSGSINFFQRF